MMRLLAATGLLLAATSTLVLAQNRPESILPPGFDDPAPAPAPSPAPRPAPAPTPRPAPGATPAPSAPPTQSNPVVQPIPGGGGSSSGSSGSSGSSSTPAPAASASELDRLPSIQELEAMSPDELDELLGLKPRYDIPPAARRAVEQVGLIAPSEGGLPTGSLANQPARLVAAVLGGIRQQTVSRWGHILLRRALASRMDAPAGMDPVAFARLRIQALNAIGEYRVARALAQDVDTDNWDEAFTAAAETAYLGSTDVLGACPVIRRGRGGDEPQDVLWRSVCNSFAGEASRSRDELRRAVNRGIAPEIDVRLAQRYAGAAGQGRAVNTEWDGVEELNPWRYALALELGEEVPEGLLDGASPYYARVAATSPALPLPQRVAGAQVAAAEGILSADAMVDLYSQIYALGGVDGPDGTAASLLRTAYTANAPADRLAALRSLWGERAGDYARLVLTAYAAARMDVADEFAQDAPTLIAAMLTAGLDRDAMRWAEVVSNGSAAWGLLAVAQPNREDQIGSGPVDSYVDDDQSAQQRKSQFLVAGLAGLGRISDGTRDDFADRLGINLTGQTRWTRAIGQAAAVDNAALVALLAGLGMQGTGWDEMTPRHLYRIVQALNEVGLEAEARMIAAEAVARG